MLAAPEPLLQMARLVSVRFQQHVHEPSEMQLHFAAGVHDYNLTLTIEGARATLLETFRVGTEFAISIRAKP
jgi:hypothetical protein